MKKNQNGFTLIEMVIVIVVLGVLSAVALPKYIDFKEQAATAASKGVAGALASASAMKYAESKLNSPYAAVVQACTSVSSYLVNGLASNFTVGGTAPSCYVENSDNKTPGTSHVAWTLSQD